MRKLFYAGILLSLAGLFGLLGYMIYIANSGTFTVMSSLMPELSRQSPHAEPAQQGRLRIGDENLFEKIPFESIHLSPEMGNLALYIALIPKGIMIDSQNKVYDVGFELIDAENGESVYQRPFSRLGPTYENEKGVNPGKILKHYYIGEIQVQKAGKYTPEIKVIQKSYLSSDIDMVFLIKTGKAPHNIAVTAFLIGLMLAGIALCVITKPNDLKIKIKVNGKTKNL